MPVIYRESGFQFFFYSNEGDPLEPAHIHVRSGENSAKYWLEPVISLESSYGFHSRDLRRIQGIIEQNFDLMLRSWNEHFSL